MSNHNTVIYNSSTFKQCLQVLTFPHSSSCNANRAPFSKLVKREQILVVCHLHGFLNQQMVQQNRQFPHLLCPLFMYNVSQKCLQRPQSAHETCQEERMQSLSHLPEPVKIRKFHSAHTGNQVSGQSEKKVVEPCCLLGNYTDVQLCDLRDTPRFPISSWNDVGNPPF